VHLEKRKKHVYSDVAHNKQHILLRVEDVKKNVSWGEHRMLEGAKKILLLRTSSPVNEKKVWWVKMKKKKQTIGHQDED